MSKALKLVTCPGRSAAQFGAALQNRDRRNLERSGSAARHFAPHRVRDK